MGRHSFTYCSNDADFSCSEPEGRDAWRSSHGNSSSARFRRRLLASISVEAAMEKPAKSRERVEEMIVIVGYK